ncbi:MAG TPA: hypothetical protein VGJ95_22230 [Pseudonocardiaceae bacterium]
MTGSSPEPPEPSPPEPSPPEPIDAEIVAPATPQPPAPDYDERGIPSLDYVRDRIEGRYATALGGTELAEGTPQAHTLEEQQAQREKAAAAKLDEIRRKLRNEPS